MEQSNSEVPDYFIEALLQRIEELEEARDALVDENAALRAQRRHVLELLENPRRTWRRQVLPWE